MHMLADGFIAASVAEFLAGDGSGLGVGAPIWFGRNFDGEAASVRPV